MKTKIYLTTLLVAIIAMPLFTLAQGVAINEDDSEADPSAILDVKSTDKGVLFPRLTSQQILDITNPATGLVVFNTEDSRFYFFDNSDGVDVWKEIAIGTNALTSFQCGDLLYDARDGQTYTTVQIGTQCWMAENLNVGTMINSSSSQSNNGTIEKYCYVDNLSNCDIYGGLYQWYEMMGHATIEGIQGICPEGWHLPTDGEYTVLTDFLGGLSVAGGKMKETGTTHWNSPNTGADNSSGFTAFGSGEKDPPGGSFQHLHNYTSFWTSSSAGDPYRRYLSSTSQEIYRTLQYHLRSFSVRCIKD